MEIGRRLSPYAVLTIGMVGVVLSLQNTLRVIQRGIAIVMREPFSLPILGVCLLTAVFLGFMAGISVARERERRILETMFYDPLTHTEYILGKFIAYWAVYYLLMFAFILSALLLAGITRLNLSFRLLLVPIFSGLPGAAVIALGLFLAAVNKSVRGTSLSFIGYLLFLVAVSLAQLALSALVQTNEMMNLVALRDGLEIANQIFRWISPISYFLDGVEAFMRQDGLAVLWHGGLAGFFALGLGSGAIWLQKRTGVLA
jgi:ABC-type transport system involved in multi-copper enzyme maturation permease subunit